MDSEHSHTLKLERPGPIGRVGRFVFGVLVGWYTIRFIGGWVAAIQQGRISLDQALYTGVVQKGNLALYGMTLLSVYFMPLWTRRQRLRGAAALFILVIGLDFVLVGDWWALPLAILMSLVIVTTFSYSGAFAHVLAGLIANPGCEQTALSNWLRASQPDFNPEIRPCILWDPVDRLEKRIWQRLRR